MARVWILLDLVVYMYIIQSRVIASKYYVSNQAVTWSEAAENCTLATPKINYTPDGKLVTLEPDLVLEDQDKLWVGYTRDYQVFRYIGCVPDEAVTSQDSLTINQDIGQCYFACSATKYKYFGVKISAGASNSAECTCITDISERNVTSCGKGPGGPEFAFGGESTMAIYTLASPAPVFTHINSSWTDKTTNCFSYFDSANGLFKWVNCTKDYPCLCTSSPTGRTGNITKTSKQWKLAGEICLKSNRYMSRYQANITTDSTSQQWLSNIKTESISSTTGPVVSEHKRYGYLKKVSGVFKLKFNEGNGKLHALCSNGDKLPEATTVTSTGTRSSSGDVYSDTTTVTNTDAGSNSEDSSLGDTIDTNMEARSSNVGVYIGVSVAIILAAVASAVAIIIWKRRQRPADTKEKVDNSTGNLAYQHSDTVVDSHNNRGYIEIDLNETTSGDYEAVHDGSAFPNKPPSPNTNTSKRETNFKMSELLDAKNNGYSYAKEIGTNNGDDTSGSDPYHTVGGETEGNSQYDHLTGPNGHVTKTDGKIHDVDEDHMYDKTEVVNTDYDHITSGPISASNTAGVQDYDTTSNVKAKRGQHSTRGINGPANTVEINDYDTTSNVKAKPDPTYDHAGV